MMVTLLGLWLSAAALAANPDLSPLPPKTLLHVGQKPHMLDNDREGTIPQETWDRHIMGESTNFALTPWRRGLYGGKDYDTLELYANLYMGSPRGKKKVPWLMKITIKDECLKPAAVTDLATDDKYLRWLFDNAAKVSQYADICLNLKTNDCRELIKGAQNTGGSGRENPCDDLMQDLLLGTKAKVVRDVEWHSSWYLRDRACIEKLEAGPGVLLETLAAAKWDQASREATLGRNGGGHGLGSVALLFGALADLEDEAPAELLDRLRAKMASSDIRMKGELERFEGPLWIREVGPLLIDAYRRCAGAGKLAEFRAASRAFEESLHDPALSAVQHVKKQMEKAEALQAALPKVCR
jgi:hypothetical protein